MDLEDIINDEYDGDETEYYKDLTLESCKVLLNLRKSKYFSDVNSLFNKHQTFITYLMTWINDVRRDEYKLQQRVNELSTILASRERELALVKHERNALMNDLTCKQSTYTPTDTTRGF